MSQGFGDLPQEYCNYDTAGVVIVPVGYDGTSTWIRGAHAGPAAIIEASAHLELYDIETDSEVYRQGIFTDVPIGGEQPPEDMIDQVSSRVQGHIEAGKLVVIVGGEHSVSLGGIRPHVERNNDLTVLQLDAHADLRDDYNGSRYNHACVMARAQEMAPAVQVGIRSMDSAETERMDRGRVFFARDIVDKNNNHWINDVLAKLSEKVYVTIDLDVFDPSVMPATGTPEPGGLLWYDVLELLRTVFCRKDVVAFDVVELCPNENHKSADFLAAKLIYKLLSYKFRG